MNTNKTIYQILLDQALLHPQKAAYDFLGFQQNYQAFLAEVDYCAAYLRELGLKEGDIITLFLPNIPRAVILFYAINKIGAISNFLHPETPVQDYQIILENIKPQAIFSLDSMPELISELAKWNCTEQLFIVKASEFMPFHLKLWMLPEDLRHRKLNRHNPGVHYYPAKYKPAVHGCPSFLGHECATIMMTSGTTSAPKGVCLSNKNINTAAMQTASYRKDPDPDDSMLAVLPLFHAYGLINCIHSAISEGLTVILLPYFKDKLFLSTIINKKPNYILGIPKLYARMAALLENQNQDLSYFKGLYCGGSKLSEPIYQKMNQLLSTHNSPTLLREGYGLSECVGACTLMPEGVYRSGSVGLPYSGVTIKIMAIHSDDFLAIGEVGRICIQSDTVMLGYYQEESPNLVMIDGERFLITEDLGYLDEEGFVYFEGRLNRMIKISGYQVHPQKIEALISRVQSVENCCVVKAYIDHIAYLKAFVVLNQDIQTALVQEQILEICNKNLPKWSIPREIEYIDAIPQTLLGKNDYRKLTE